MCWVGGLKRVRSSTTWRVSTTTASGSSPRRLRCRTGPSAPPVSPSQGPSKERASSPFQRAHVWLGRFCCSNCLYLLDFDNIVMREIIGCCGIVCSNCDIYKATNDDNNDLRDIIFKREIEGGGMATDFKSYLVENIRWRISTAMVALLRINALWINL